MAVEQKKSGWGGRREGAGRKPKPKRDRTGELMEFLGPSPRESPGAVDPSEHFARFCSLCRVTQGKNAGQKLVLEPWEREFVDEALSVDASGNRRYHRAGIIAPRKSGKSTMAAALGLYLASPADGEERPVVIQAAGSREQASEGFDHMRHFLLQADDVLRDLFTIGAHQIKSNANSGIIKKVSGVGDLNLGLNPSVVLADELATWSTTAQTKNWQSLTTGQGAREDPLVLFLTTAGEEHEGPLWELLERVRKGEQTITERRGPCFTIYRDLENKVLLHVYAVPPGTPFARSVPG